MDSISWNVEQVWGSDRFHSEGDVAEDQIAFVVDSGIAKLDDLNVNEEWSKSFVSGYDDPFDDRTGHGTAVASIIGAKANNQGLTGVAPGAQVVALRVFGAGGWTTSRIVTAALEHAKNVIIENNLFDKAVINLSLGGHIPDNHPIVREMADLGIKFAIAAGNSAADVDTKSPACYGDHENVYTVSSNTKEGTYSGFTNFDNADEDGLDDVDFAAPGSGIATYNTDGTIGRRGGTSFSAPHVAGLLLMSDIKAGDVFELSPAQVAKGMVADPRALFDPETYKHGSGVKPPVSPPVQPPVEPPPPPVIERVILKGDRFDNIINGGDNRDRLRGLKGDDTIYGHAGNDFIRGGQGDDYLDGGKGMDIIFTGAGNDIVANQRDFNPDIIFVRASKGHVKTIEMLDAVDRIGIQGVNTDDITILHTADAKQIYANGNLVANYEGKNLRFSDFQDMVFGIT